MATKITYVVYIVILLTMLGYSICSTNVIIFFRLTSLACASYL